MTQEEKARRYDEALERAKDFYKGYKQRDNQLYADDLETIFPELCESEDEMIRKELIKHLKDGAEGYMPAGDSEDYARWLAWVEKQDEKKSQRMVSAEAKEALYDKPTDEEMKELLRTEYEKGRADTIAEMKSSWSEEDERMCQETIDWFEKKCFPYALESENPARESIKWLKSLKDRVQPQPKHEWSLEDERVIAIINNALTESNTPPDDYDKVYDWLESLRQRIGG